MGLFDKKYCDVCNNKIGMLGNRKLDDGNLCKDCAKLLSPWTTDRRRQTVEDIKAHLAYREANKAEVEKFNATQTLGNYTKVYLDEDNRKFMVTSDARWRNGNPDIIDFSQVTGTNLDIREGRREIKRKLPDGKEESYSPQRYEYDYDFYFTIYVNLPWFSEINFKLNTNQIDSRMSVDFREAEELARRIKDTLTQVRVDTRERIESANAPRTSVICPNCGATTLPDANNSCEFCGGPVA